MTAWDTSGRVKIERAKEHISNLETEITAFGKRDPYVTVPKIDAQTGEVIVNVRVHELPPLRWGAIAGDAAHNLRSALNVLWRTVYTVPILDENRKDDFPIFDSADAFKSRFGGKHQGARQPIVNLLKALKPYKGGNDLLWMLHVIEVTDKHQLLIPVFMNFGGGTLTLTPKGEASVFYQMTGRQPILLVEDGTELFRIRKPMRAGLEMKVDVKITLPVAFAKPKVVEGQPIVATLYQLAGVVDGIVETFRLAGLVA